MSAVAASAGSETADPRGTGGTGGPRRSGGPQWPGDLPLPADVLGPGDLLSADELPDRLVVADECGRGVIFHPAAEPGTRLGADQALGRGLGTAPPPAAAEG